MDRHSANERVWIEDLNAAMNPRLTAEWSKGTPADWATDSLQVAKKAYRLPGTGAVMDSGTRLGDNYCRMALPII